MTPKHSQTTTKPHKIRWVEAERDLAIRGVLLPSMTCDQNHRLINVDFFPGPKPDLTIEKFVDTVNSVMKEVSDSEPGLPPTTGRERTTLREFLL